MKKDFDDFMKEMDSKDWSLVINRINQSQSNSIGQNLQLFLTVLREYHDWLNKEI